MFTLDPMLPAQDPEMKLAAQNKGKSVQLAGLKGYLLQGAALLTSLKESESVGPVLKTAGLQASSESLCYLA